MLYRLLADAVLLLHLAFILFVVAGAVLVWRWRTLAWCHVPAVAWGFYIELSGRLCPLTPLEVWLRRMGGEAGYGNGFVAQYLLPLIYPEGLGRDAQLLLSLGILAPNIVFYSWFWLAKKKAQRG